MSSVVALGEVTGFGINGDDGREGEAVEFAAEAEGPGVVGGIEDDAGIVSAGGELGEMGVGGAEDDAAVGGGDPKVSSCVECGKKQEVLQG